MPNDEDKVLTSIRVFRRFLTRTPKGEIIADQVISKSCYECWLSTRKQSTPNPEKAFQRALSAHLGAADGRIPFTGKLWKSGNLRQRVTLKNVLTKTEQICSGRGGGDIESDSNETKVAVF